MAQAEGFEPPTKRLTAACSTTELRLNSTVSLIIKCVLLNCQLCFERVYSAQCEFLRWFDGGRN